MIRIYIQFLCVRVITSFILSYSLDNKQWWTLTIHSPRPTSMVSILTFLTFILIQWLHSAGQTRIFADCVRHIQSNINFIFSLFCNWRVSLWFPVFSLFLFLVSRCRQDLCSRFQSIIKKGMRFLDLYQFDRPMSFPFVVLFFFWVKIFLSPGRLFFCRQINYLSSKTIKFD